MSKAVTGNLLPHPKEENVDLEFRLDLSLITILTAWKRLRWMLLEIVAESRDESLHSWEYSGLLFVHTYSWQLKNCRPLK